MENGDPLVHKKARNDMNSMPPPPLPPPTRPTLMHVMPDPGQTSHHAMTESSDCGDNMSSDDEAIVVEDSDDTGDGETVEGESTDEDDDAELGT